MYNTTGFTFAGHEIVAEHGLVRGIIVRSRSIVGSIGASLQTLIGGNITIYANMCERARQDAFEQMMEHAQSMGANAVMGVRYDATEVMPGVTEVLCYGTAVAIAPVGRKSPPGF